MGTSKLKVILAEKDISIKELASATGLSTRSISDIVNGKSRPYIDNAYRIAEALGMHIDRVFPNYYKYGSIARRRTRSS